MSAFLLDTDTLSLLQFGHATIVQRASSHADSSISIGVVSFQEQVKGWLGRLGRLRTTSKLADWYDRLVVRMFPAWKKYQLLPFPENAIRRFEHLRSLRLNVGMMDLRIAATGLENGLTVVTRNVRDFARVPGLTIEDWSA